MGSCGNDEFHSEKMHVADFFEEAVCLPGVGRVAQSVKRLTTSLTVRDRIPVGTRFSARPDRPWGPPSLLYNGYWAFTVGKVRPERAADHSPHSSAAVMEEKSYTPTQPLSHTGPVTGILYRLPIKTPSGPINRRLFTSSV